MVVGAAPIRDPNQEDLRYSLVITDVSELKAMPHPLEMRANELEWVNQELCMLERTKDSFLSNVTHELRTPLSTIRRYIEMLEGGNGSTEQWRTALEMMDRLQSIIEEMLQFSRMQIRGVQLSTRLFGLEHLVREQLKSHHPQANEKNISFEERSPGGQTPLGWGDPGMLNQVLTILLSHAINLKTAVDHWCWGVTPFVLRPIRERPAHLRGEAPEPYGNLVMGSNSACFCPRAQTQPPFLSFLS